MGKTNSIKGPVGVRTVSMPCSSKYDGILMYADEQSKLSAGTGHENI